VEVVMKKIWLSKSFLLAVPVLASVGLAAVWGHAGQKSTAEVYVYAPTSGGGYAGGSLGSARAGAGANQHIGCSVDAYTGSVYLTCWARDSGGVSVSCSATSSRLIAAANSMNNDSYVSFSWDENANCTNLYISNRSVYAPKTL
jgi:hypothetical protein